MKDVTSLRNASGRRLVAIDPEVSEWGNPICEDHPLLESEKLTQGSETSQYLEE
jgi:hypothetical protein